MKCGIDITFSQANDFLGKQCLILTVATKYIPISICSFMHYEDFLSFNSGVGAKGARTALQRNS